ncbi:hypothetical protein [Paenibacillus elgii]|uniref:hypothetical protein n=1 Tax=Paenibacillus elgii TaxID=189691 RepID=UPI0020401926|nr:hypothetical protein [Paenibacillus elgii]MCM3272018.1 hypothetical protein [Paenibacillus elgii]
MPWSIITASHFQAATVFFVRKEAAAVFIGAVSFENIQYRFKKRERATDKLMVWKRKVFFLSH